MPPKNPTPPPPDANQIRRGVARRLLFALFDFLAEQRVRLVLLTYRHAYLYKRDAGECWPTAFAKPPEQVQLPFSIELPGAKRKTLPPKTRVLPQRESICFDPSGNKLFIASEQPSWSDEALLACTSK